MTRRSRKRILLPALAALPALAGCGPQFESPSEIDTLRVLAVQKDRPYARPGDEVRLKMLWSDGLEAGTTGRPIQVGWLGGCVNPLGDLYAGCFAPGAFQVDPATGLPPLGTGDEFSFTVPDTIISDRPPPPDPRQPPYGLSFVFFAACAGTLDFSTPPIRCLDDDGRDLGSEDFVAGYTAIYVYDEFRNSNPIVRGLTFDGKPLADVCVDPGSAAAAQSDELGALLGRAATGAGTTQSPPPVCDSEAPAMPPDPPDCSAPNAPCVTALPDDGVFHPPPKVRPEVYSSSVEPDEVSKVAYGEDFEEQMWINYYATRGSLRSDVRLLNDATTGLNDEFHTELAVPIEPGPLVLWAVVHDNRGGVAWARGTLFVE